jgi:putative membrane protein
MIAPSLLLFGALYAIGTARLWMAAGAGQGVRFREAASFAAGWAALLVALESPIHEWSETLFVAHMVQHELIMIVAAPLMALGAPLIATLWALPRSWRRRCSDGLRLARRRPALSWIVAPGAVFCAHALILWIWHIPTLYDAALTHDGLHAVQHASFFVTAMLFWWTVARGAYGHGGYGASVLYVFGTAIQSGILGALLTLSQRLWYPAYGGAAEWHLTALEDQQLAGLMMWIPASIVFTAAGLTFLAAWLRASEKGLDHYPAAGFRASPTPRSGTSGAAAQRR